MESTLGEKPEALTGLGVALKASLASPTFLDVKLYGFSRRSTTSEGDVVIDKPQPVLAMSSVLKRHVYFANLLSKKFSEGFVSGSPSSLPDHAEEGEYDYESDSDLDDSEEDAGVDETVLEHDIITSSDLLSENSSSATPTLYFQTGCQEVLIRNVAFRTLRAFVFYLYTSKLNFMPLISEGDGARRVELIRRDADPYAIPPCSPKSMYRFADLCGHTTLQACAFDAITARLSPKNIVKESFSRFTSLSPYKKLREHEISVLCQNWSHDDVAAILPDVIGRTVLGEFPHAGELLVSLLGLRLSLQLKDQSSAETTTEDHQILNRNVNKAAKKKMNAKAKRIAYPPTVQQIGDGILRWDMDE